VNFAGLKIFAIFANGKLFSLKTGKNTNNSLELVKTGKNTNKKHKVRKNDGDLKKEIKKDKI